MLPQPKHDPLHHLGPRTKKTTLDEALHALVGNIRMVPRLHGKQGGEGMIVSPKAKERGRETLALAVEKWRR
jgi:hypothetical protein